MRSYRTVSPLPARRRAENQAIWLFLCSTTFVYRLDVKIAPSKAGQAVAAFAASAKEGEESPDSTGQGDG